MKRYLLGIVIVLLPLGEPVAAECLYHGVAYSEGARICMHRTMYMCRGERWVKTAERCWGWSFVGRPCSLVYGDPAQACGSLDHWLFAGEECHHPVRFTGQNSLAKSRKVYLSPNR
jgi:hypothetical protein